MNDNDVEEVIRPSPAYTDELVAPRSVAREAIEVLSAAEATQAARLHQELSPEHQAIVLSGQWYLDGHA